MNEAKIILSNYRNLKIALVNLKEKYVKLKYDDGVKGIEYGVSVQGGGGTDDKLINNIYEKKETHKQIVETQKMITRINNILKNLDKENREVLEKFYIKEKTITEILEEMHISKSQFYRLKTKALRQLAVQLFGIVAVA